MGVPSRSRLPNMTQKKAKAAPRPGLPDDLDTHVGEDDYDGEVDVIRTGQGAVIVLPTRLRKASNDQLEAVADLQTIATTISRQVELLGDAVRTARSLGLSWDSIGWSVGTTGNAANKR